MRLLDLFCGGGGAALGYDRAGIGEIVGVDNRPQPDYPYELVVGDALAFVHKYGREFDLIHASPPCQISSAPSRGTNRASYWRRHKDLVPATRDELLRIRRPYVIENVVGAILRPDVELCGEMFGLPIIRHRVFELGRWSAAQPAHIPHRGKVRGWRHGEYQDGPYLALYGEGGGKASLVEGQAALDIPHIRDRKTLVQAIPPAYTEYLGREWLAQYGEESA